jgi:hypothetical protein
MKSELTHLLQKLKAEHLDFQNLTIPSTGAPILAIGRWGVVRRFESLDALEAYAWPQMGSTDPVAPSAQDKVGSVAPRGPLPTTTIGFHQTQTAP